MQTMMVHVCESAGVLRSVAGLFARDLAPSETPMLEGLLMRFSSAQLLVQVTDEDEVCLADSIPPGDVPRFLWRDLACEQPWVRVIGRSVSWAWSLKNQQGYADGLQLEFQPVEEGAADTVQLLCLGGEVRVRAVRETTNPREPSELPEWAFD